MKLTRLGVLALTGTIGLTAYGCGSSSSCADDCDPGAGGTSGAGGSSGTTGGKSGVSGASGKGTAGSAGVGTGGSTAAGAGGSSSKGGSSAGGGKSSSGGSGGAAGSGGADAGASSGEGGAGDGAGGVPGGGVGGTGASGGAGAGAGNGGSSGSNDAGAPSSEVECERADDCALFSDCCDCQAVPAEARPAACEFVCVQSRCSALQISADSVTCSFGRCVFSLSCDASQVTCREAPPTCESGSLPSVEGSCWGPCLEATECQDVTACDDCPSGTVCVEFQSQLPSFRCVAPPAGCGPGNYCDCLPGACNAPRACTEKGDEVVCPCPQC